MFKQILLLVCLLTYLKSKQIKLKMANKRTQFLNRLLRISELNQELMEIGQKGNKQPAFAKKIKLVQMNPCNINLPQSYSSANNPQKMFCKILVLNKSVTKNNQASSCRNETIVMDQQMQKSSISPAKLHIHQSKSLIDKKRISVNIDQKINQQQIQMSNSISCEGRYLPSRVEQLNRKKFNFKDSSIIGRRNYYDRRGGQSTKIIHQQSVINTQANYLPVKSVESQKAINLQIKGEKEPKYFKSLNHASHYSNQKQIQQQKKAKLSLIKQINKNYAKPFIPPPKITAKSYIVCQARQNEQNLKVVVSYNSKNSQQVASLTKIMTCILTIQFCEKNTISLDEEQVKIGRYQSNIGGTTAHLQQGQIYTVKQLLYGLMLPSGNDASLALAVWCGKRHILLDRSNANKGELSTDNSIVLGERLVKSDCYSRFVRQMNSKAQTLKMMKTHYANSHGLVNASNRSTAYDIAILSSYAMKNAIFREIVSCKSYSCTIKYYQFTPKIEQLKQQDQNNKTQPDQIVDEQTRPKYQNMQVQYFRLQKTHRPATAKAQSQISTPLKHSKSKDYLYPPLPTQIKWQNTHRLVHSKPREYLGIKTGITANAGPCLSSCITIENRIFIVVVLNCGKINLRFKQTEILKKWLYKHEGIVKCVKKIANLKLTKSIKSINKEEQQSEDEYDLIQDEQMQKD